MAEKAMFNFKKCFEKENSIKGGHLQSVTNKGDSVTICNRRRKISVPFWMMV